MLLGFSAFGLPILGDIFPPHFPSHLYYSLCHTKSQDFFLFGVWGRNPNRFKGVFQGGKSKSPLEFALLLCRKAKKIYVLTQKHQFSVLLALPQSLRDSFPLRGRLFTLRLRFLLRLLQPLPLPLLPLHEVRRQRK